MNLKDDSIFKYLSENNLIIPIYLITLMIITLAIRTIPIINLGTGDILNIVGSDDPLYSLRQVEQMVLNYPKYGWFEAMTLFPTGQVVNWGPMFTWILTTACLMMGATTRTEIISVALMIPPLMATALVPITYYLVRKVTDQFTGALGALLIAVVGGQYFFRSLAGYLDHHIAEVLFSTLFLLIYIITLQHIRESNGATDKKTLKKTVLLSVVAGIIYLMGLFTMPTIILFALIVAIYTVIQFTWDFWHGKSSETLAIVNIISFGIIAFMGYFIVGNQFDVLTLAHYTMAHPISYLLLALVTVILCLFQRGLKDTPKWYFLIGLAGLGVFIAAILFIIIPSIGSTFTAGISEFFGQVPYYATIQEARAWTVQEAWRTFNLGLVLAAIGVGVAAHRFWKMGRGEFLFLMVWALFITYSVWQHIRYEYYFAMVVAVMGAIGAGFFFRMAIPELLLMRKESNSEEIPKDKGKKKPVARKKKPNIAAIVVAVPIIACFCTFTASSLYIDYSVAGLHPQMNQEWRGALEWMQEKTPDAGVDYFAVYEKDTFEYPDAAYGVMSWWDYGHMITYIAKRIPNANPFQAGVIGDYGAASFFITSDENTANGIAEKLGTRYVVTDIEMATGKFWAMATWYNASVGQTPYQKIYLVPDNPVNPSKFSPVTVYTGDYFGTMISRLHNYDGSLVVPGLTYYIEYMMMPEIGPYPVIIRINETDSVTAHQQKDEFNRNPPRQGVYAAVVSPFIFMPTTRVPSLDHYRLVYESPSNTVPGSGTDIKYVKVFEYVEGARVKGDGVLEVVVTTNTGRDFVYRQISQNGEFILPYSTEGNPYDVRVTRGYLINGVLLKGAVTEDAVLTGTTIGG